MIGSAHRRRGELAHGGDAVAYTQSDRDVARQRLEDKQALVVDAVSYLVVNACLVALWALTGAGYFWPGWVMAAWGAGLVLHAWGVYFKRPITEADVDEELRRGR